MDTPLPRATLFNTEVRSFPSEIMGITYQISTWFPLNYSKANQKYPVIYLLDGDVFLGLMSGIVGGLVYTHIIPDCLIVGIGHDISTSEEWWKARAVDLNPPENPKVTYARWMQPYKIRRAPDFLRFLKSELIPFIETTYPADPANRLLAGFSWGGQFAIYSLFHEPDLFSKYLIASGFWEHMLPEYLAYEEELAQQRKSLPVHAFFSVGSLEDGQVPYFPQFIEALRRRNYDDFCMDTLVIEGADHGSGQAIAYIHGLRALYSSN